MLAANDEQAKERCMEVYGRDERKVKRCIYQGKMKVNNQFGRKNEDVNGKRKLFWKEMSNAKGGELQQNKGWKWKVSTRRG